ncbi:MAG: DUF2778 domain-containing protein [Alphaproteobacteria bacterium]|nr:DUF2778 domain-containing protein [Alphaproteobacteria bacterium]MBQ8557956.1 DUF2778 domain-containing protein [Alphaproteobacteria bacterium]
MSDIRQMIRGEKPIKRTNPQAGQSAYYYLDTRNRPDNFTLLTDVPQIDVVGPDSPNPLRQVSTPENYTPSSPAYATAGITHGNNVSVSPHHSPVDNMTRPAQVAVNPTTNLSFDGRYLTLNENGQPVQQWPAQSGHADYQCADNVQTVNKGPIPQGNWIVDQSQVQHIDDLGFADRLKNYAGVIKNPTTGNPIAGKWPGDTMAWGHHRVWLTPEQGTNTYGRNGFTIHGGSDYNSAGCIDLAGQDANFFKTIQDKGNLRLNVQYPNNCWEPR